MSAARHLQKAIFEALAGDAGLLALLGPGAVLDHVPPGQKPPYLVFDEIASTDWSTATEAGEEHQVTLAAWSGAGGRREAVAVASAAETAMSALDTVGGGFALVNLLFQSVMTRREEKSGLYKAVLVFRAVTEPLA